MNASPAAVGSTAFTLCAGKRFDPLAVTSIDPSLPIFTTTVPAPSSNSFSAAWRAEPPPFLYTDRLLDYINLTSNPSTPASDSPSVLRVRL